MKKWLLLPLLLAGCPTTKSAEPEVQDAETGLQRKVRREAERNVNQRSGRIERPAGATQ